MRPPLQRRVALISLAAAISVTGTAHAVTGDLTMQGCLATNHATGCALGNGVAGTHGVAVSPDGANVYAVGKTPGAIAALQREPATGALSELGCFSAGGVDSCTAAPGLIGAAGVAISPDGDQVYVASDTSNAVSTFSRDASSGAITPAGCVALTTADGCSSGAGVAGATGITVSPDGRSVYVASELSSGIATFNRASDGTLTELGCINATGSGGCAAGSGLAHATGVAVSANGANVYVTSIDSGSITTFARAADGTLTQTDCIAESALPGCTQGQGLAGADGLALSPDGSTLYVASETGSAVAIFSRSASGALTQQGCLGESSADGCAPARGLNGAARVVVSADGRTTYVAGFPGDTLVTFDRASDGSLTERACMGQPGNGDLCPGVLGLAGPASLALSPDNASLYVAAKDSNALTVLRREVPPPAPAGPPAPAATRMDALGDEITLGTASGGACANTADCPANSWASGTDVDSHVRRLALFAPTAAFNRAAGGPIAGLDAQVQQAIADAPGYVTILAGLDDVCGADGSMTSTTDFRSAFAAALDDLTSHLPGTRVFVASVPDPYRLWSVLHDDGRAVSAWTANSTCPALLANPTSTAPADEARRRSVEARVGTYNDQLAAECAQHPLCRYDGGAVFNWRFAPYDISATDFLHPSKQGEEDLAEVTYRAGFAWFKPRAPAAATGDSSSVSASAATLSGSVNPEGQATTYAFEYGTSADYGTATGSADTGDGVTDQAVSTAISGLSPDTTYHYRVRATSGLGTALGADRTFTTGSAPPPVSAPSQSPPASTPPPSVPSPPATTPPSAQTPPAPRALSYADAVHDSDPISFWPLDDATGTTAVDAEGTSNGLYSGTVLLGRAGAIAGTFAADFDGRSGHVVVFDTPSLHTGDRFTLEAWVKPTRLGRSQAIMAKRGAYILYLDASGRLVLSRPGHGVLAKAKKASAIKKAGGWHYVAATKNGSHVHLYLDGADVTGLVNHSTVLDSSGNVVLATGGPLLSGALDDVALYGSALSSKVVAAHYDAARGRGAAAAAQEKLKARPKGPKPSKP